MFLRIFPAWRYHNGIIFPNLRLCFLNCVWCLEDKKRDARDREISASSSDLFRRTRGRHCYPRLRRWVERCPQRTKIPSRTPETTETTERDALWQDIHRWRGRYLDDFNVLRYVLTKFFAELSSIMLSSWIDDVMMQIFRHNPMIYDLLRKKNHAKNDTYHCVI